MVDQQTRKYLSAGGTYRFEKAHIDYLKREIQIITRVIQVDEQRISSTFFISTLPP